LKTGLVKKKVVLAFENQDLPFEKGVLAFVKGVLAFQWLLSRYYKVDDGNRLAPSCSNKTNTGCS
jgi:hypothetical protein